MHINIAGIIGIVVFYLLILIVGIWAAKKKGTGSETEEEVMLAGRNIGLFVGIFTMTGKIFEPYPLPWQPNLKRHPDNINNFLYFTFNFSYLGRWRIHFGNGRRDLHQRTALVSSTVRLRT